MKTPNRQALIAGLEEALAAVMVTIIFVGGFGLALFLLCDAATKIPALKIRVEVVQISGSSGGTSK